MWCYSRIFFRRGFLYIYSHYVNPLLTWPLKRLRLHDWQQKPHVPGSRLLSDCGTDVMADCSKKRGEHYISCVDWQRGPPRYLTMLTQDVRIGDKAVHRDKEMRKIEKCSPICQMDYMTGLWSSNGENLFFSFPKFSHTCWHPELRWIFTVSLAFMFNLPIASVKN